MTAFKLYYSAELIASLITEGCLGAFFRRRDAPSMTLRNSRRTVARHPFWAVKSAKGVWYYKRLGAFVRRVFAGVLFSW